MRKQRTRTRTKLMKRHHFTTALAQEITSPNWRRKMAATLMTLKVAIQLPNISIIFRSRADLRCPGEIGVCVLLTSWKETRVLILPLKRCTTLPRI
jgi:hypothetical protein